jgi:RNA polymerase sigma-70 factor (ECF subfamily)
VKGLLISNTVDVRRRSSVGTSFMTESEGDEHEALLGAIATGDVQALERLYRELRTAVFAVALAVVRDRVAAEDALHDAFVRIWEKAHTYRPGTRPRAWVLSIARNTAIDARRRNARRPPVEHLAEAGNGLSRLTMTEALMTLDAVERSIVALRVLGGLTHAEIANELGLPAGTVRWKYRVALTRLEPLFTEARNG